MNYFLKSGLVAALLFVFSINCSLAQSLKLEELTSCITAKNYPDCLFEMVEAKGFYRIDKQYLPYCDRVVYAFQKEGRPTMFVNPVLCPKPQRSEIFPVRVKTEVELQFQIGGRTQFENLNAAIRKQCKALPDENGTIPGSKSKATKRAYRHEASGITLVVVNSAPVAYIYLLK